MQILKAAVIILLIFSVDAWAKGKKPAAFAPSMDLMNLVYIPHQGVFEINPRVSASVFDRTNNSQSTSTATTATNIFADVQYGVTDNFRVGLQESLLWDQTVITTGPAGAQSDANSAGLSNPTVAVGWRYFENNNSGLAGDVSSYITPALNAHVNGSGAQGKLGNNMAGGWVAEAATTMFWYLPKNEVKIVAEGLRYFKKHIETGAPATDYETAPYWSENFTVTDRIHFTGKFYFQGSLSYILESKWTQTVNSGVTRDLTDNGYFSGRVDFGFQPDRDIVLDLAFSGSQNITVSDSSVTASDNNTRTTTVTALLELFHQF